MNTMRTPIVIFLLHHYKRLAIVFFLSGISAYLITRFLVTPLYSAETVIYVPNTHANIHLVQAGMRFGYDKEVGEHIEVLSSNAVKNDMIREFKLSDLYQLDTNQPQELDRLYKLYDKSISIDRSINKSIHITALDEDPQRAAEMANTLVKFADNHKSKIINSNIYAAAIAAKADYKKWEQRVAMMSDSLEVLRQAGEAIWNLGEERKSSRFENYEIQYRKEIDEYYALRKRYDELETLLNQEIPKSYVISKAYESGKPASPQKLLISLLVACLSTLLTLIILSTPKTLDQAV